MKVILLKAGGYVSRLDDVVSNAEKLEELALGIIMKVLSLAL